MIIGLSGKIGSGKDTVAGIIQEIRSTENWQVKKFAGLLKKFASDLTGVPVERFEDQEFKRQNMPAEWSNNGAPMTYRELLQKLGTDAIRDGLHTNVWINGLFATYNQDKNWIITDCRFPNEAQSIIDRHGILIRINRNQDTGDHPSETALDNWSQWHYVIDNTESIEALRLLVRDILSEI
jgi:hypothetical protein